MKKKTLLSTSILIFIVLITMIGLVACNKEDDAPLPTPAEEPIICTISFLKGSNPDAELYEARENGTWEFAINTKIYVKVDFTLKNSSPEDDIVDFKVSIPGAKYYSTTEYVSGTQVPTKQDETPRVINEAGDTIQVVEISGMQFVVKAGKSLHYTYCFAISANQVCADMTFEAKFSPESGHIFARNVKFEKSYDFVE